MTDASTEMSLDVAPPVQPVPAAKIEAALPDAAPAEQVAERTLPFEVDHLGPLRRAVLDHLLDTEGQQSVARILASMPPGTTRGSAESAIKREFDQGRIIRTSPGHYVLAPPKPPEAQKPAPPPPAPTPDNEAMWFSVLETWAVDPASWNIEELGPSPNQVDNRIPPAVKMRFNDRQRKRQKRRREAEAAAAKRAAVDQELRDRLIAATRGNIVRGPGIDDVAPIKLALEVVPLERILSSIRCKTNKKLYPRNEAASSWRERRLLKAIAEDYCGSVIVPRLVAAWEAAGRAPATKAQSLPPAGDMPDDTDELRGQHDDPHAPAGPHSLAATGDATPQPADASEVPAAVACTP